jgi:hypothetical protein
MKNSAYRFIFTALVSSSPSCPPRPRPRPSPSVPRHRRRRPARRALRLAFSSLLKCSCPSARLPLFLFAAFSLLRSYALPLFPLTTGLSVPSRAIRGYRVHSRVSSFADLASRTPSLFLFSRPTAATYAPSSTHTRACARKIAEQRANSMTVK